MTGNETTPQPTGAEGPTLTSSAQSNCSQGGKRTWNLIDRTDLRNRWAEATGENPQLLDDARWLDIASAITTGRSLLPWTSNLEGGVEEVWNLPPRTPGDFLDALDAQVEDEFGTDLQHIDWEGADDNETEES